MQQLRRWQVQQTYYVVKFLLNLIHNVDVAGPSKVLDWERRRFTTKWN